jgi:hypothetical protein
MALIYIGLLVYFKAIGGYKAETLVGEIDDPEKYAGGVAGPVEA